MTDPVTAPELGVAEVENSAAIVTVQVRPEWPARDYSFRDPAQARMFLASCKRDGDYRAALRSAAAAARSGGE